MIAAPEAPATKARRWMTQDEIDRIVRFAAAALVFEAQTTSELLDKLEKANEAPPADSRSGRLRQLEKALQSSTALEAGIQAEQGVFENGKGRPARIRWHVDERAKRLVAA